MADGSTDGELDAILARAIADAREAWPSIILDDDAFRQSLVRAGGGPAAVASLCASDLYLAQACARGDARALAAFDRQFLSQVPAFLARHPARALADEVTQVLRERLLVPRDGGPPRIAEYSGRGALASWLRVAALRAASNLVRGGKAHDELDDHHLPSDALPEVPELRVLESRYRQTFRDAFRRSFASLDAGDRTLLKLHFVDGVTVRKLAPILGTSSATAGRRLIAAQQRLGDLVIESLAAETDQPADDLESMVRAIMSKLEVSLSALVG